MGKFLTPLKSEEVSTGSLFKPPVYRLIDPLVYDSKNVGVIVVDKNAKTDFDSTPRIPIFYMLLGNRGKAPAVIHDRLYSAPHETIPGSGITVDRATADKVLRGATYEGLRIAEPETIFDNLANIVCLMIAWLIWLGVRIGGASHWER